MFFLDWVTNKGMHSIKSALDWSKWNCMCNSRASTNGTAAEYLRILCTKYVHNEKSQLRFVEMFPPLHNLYHVIQHFSIQHFSSETQATYKISPVFKITHAKLNYSNEKTARWICIQMREMSSSDDIVTRLRIESSDNLGSIFDGGRFFFG